MARARNKPRAGSIAFYPRVRAQKQTPSFSTFPDAEKETKPLNFFGYKTGMVHVIAQSLHQKGRHDKMDVQIPTTVIECPPMNVFGVRAYSRNTHGITAMGEITVEKAGKNFLKKIPTFKKKTPNKKPASKKNQKTASLTFDDLVSKKDELYSVRLLAHTNPEKTTIGKKKVEISEVALSGGIGEQINYAKEKLGKELTIQDVFEEGQLIDVKGVTRGFGMGGPVKRFGIKRLGRKHKKNRSVGSISPLRPKTVMWTVARPGQTGYHNRTEYNKKIIKIEKDSAKVNPKEGFEGYGEVRNDFVLIRGSVPGPVKRLIGLRNAIRPVDDPHKKFGEISFVSSTGGVF
jgi:large subunit ribosomal protein L3